MPAEDEGKPGQKDSMSKKGKCDVQAKGEEILGEQGRGQGGPRGVILPDTGGWDQGAGVNFRT